MNFFSQFLFPKFPIKILLIYIVGCEQEALNKAENNDTTITAWFKLNQIDKTAILTYIMILQIIIHSLGKSGKNERRTEVML